MKLTLLIGSVLLFCFIAAEDAPGFFLKTAKNIPRLGKRNNPFLKQGGKNIPRLGRRSEALPRTVDEFKFYNHVQPFDSKFILDFLSDEVFVDGDLKYVSWTDFDKALEGDTELKNKLISIARDKEIEELKKLVYATGNFENQNNEIYGRPHTYSDSNSEKVYQNFIPYDANNKYNNMENEAYFYQLSDKRSGGKDLK